MSQVSRRGVLGGTAAGVALLPALARSETSPPRVERPQGEDAPPPHGRSITLMVNGRPIALTIEPRTSLLDVLREQAGLTGTKKGCDRGSCGACTVHVDGRRVVSCLTLAARCEGRAVLTIEGLADAQGEMHPMQAAFVEHDALQCGYCTPGQIMSAVALVKEGHAGSPDEIREWMSGNICRCGAYPNIVAAVQSLAGKV